MYTLCVSPFSLLILEFEDGFPDEDVSGTVMVGVWRASSRNGPVWGTVDGTWSKDRINQRLYTPSSVYRCHLPDLPSGTMVF